VFSLVAQTWPDAERRIIHRMSGLDTIMVAKVMDAVRDVVPLRLACA
jgi:hypothetical protein